MEKGNIEQIHWLGFPKKLVKLCRILNNEIYSKVKIGKHSFSEFKVKKKKGLRTGDAIAPLLFNIVLEIAIRRSKVLYSFFCVIPRRWNFISRRFGTLCLSHLQRSYEQEEQLGVETRGTIFDKCSHIIAYADDVVITGRLQEVEEVLTSQVEKNK